MRNLNLLTIQAVLFSAATLAFAAETKPVAKSGIKALQLVSEVNSIQPGKTFSMGLFIQHLPEYHTYWKAPGIVGVPTTMTWELPDGFSASGIEWPVPELTKMAQYTAYGYERDVCLATEISVPEGIKSESITLKARVAFMCCAKTCHPGWHDFELTLPVNRKPEPDLDRKWQKKLDQTRKETPPLAPENWTLEAVETNHEIHLSLISPAKAFPEGNGIYCFCESNLVNSDVAQAVQWSEDHKKLTFTLSKSEFGPENLKTFSGWLYHPNGWPGTSSNWVRISVPMSSS